MSKRFHLGIDYGTSTSKLVLRDFQAPGGEKAYVICRNGTYRIPSTVGVTRSDLIFGQTPAGVQSEVCWYESIKMRVAGTIKGDYRGYCFAPCPENPQEFSDEQLATLSVWFLLSVAHRAVAARESRSSKWLSWASGTPDFKMAMTMGIPTSFFDDPDLRAGFLEIARVAYELYLGGPMNGDRIGRTEARQKLDGALASVSSKPAVDLSDLRDWIRMEAEAALHWPFQSPAVADGPYAKLDIGAGTTNASIFRIVASRESRYLTKERITFFGACSRPYGMDALDAAIARALQMQPQEVLSLRGQEDLKLEQPRVMEAVDATVDTIHGAYRDAWARARPKLLAEAEQAAWLKHQIFFIGGGSRIARLVKNLARSPLPKGQPHTTVDLATPDDLFIKRDERVAPADMVFLAVAHGLSNPALSIPEAEAPTDVSAMDVRAPQPKKAKPSEDERDAWRWG